MKCKHCGQRIVLTGIGWRHSPRSRWPQERLCKWCRDPRLAGRRTAEPDTGISKAVFDRDIAPTLDQYAEAGEGDE
ncbi:hypothetical protein GMA1_50 [Gordonia phage GMA1]|uniref:hypothetical protein n=1 Tax=Gordonia phage GMA1 TaxID=1647470 RepID=UPI0007B64021|nr:hypothetical protein BH788_gp50 [Gordonia phage GMA1]AKJ72147.1 hypothetical protein GMA1_50 [Gordonia phage GMA1]